MLLGLLRGDVLESCISYEQGEAGAIRVLCRYINISIVEPSISEEEQSSFSLTNREPPFWLLTPLLLQLLGMTYPPLDLPCSTLPRQHGSVAHVIIWILYVMHGKHESRAVAKFTKCRQCRGDQCLSLQRHTQCISALSGIVAPRLSLFASV